MVKKPIFAKRDADFYLALRKRVDGYFKEQGIREKANGVMYAKTLFFLSLFLSAYALLLLGGFGGWSALWEYLILGIAVAFMIMNTSHDGLHRAYSSYPALNRLLGFLMDLCGKSSYFWGKEHVVDHHTFTNIGGHDHDLNIENPFLRLCPKAPLKPHHRLQHWYAPLLYCLYPVLSEFEEIIKSFQIDGLWIKIQILSLKLVHFFLFLFLPKISLGLSWSQLGLGYLCYGVGVGATLAFVFQLAHIVENVAFPAPDEEGNLGETFLIHQLKTTSNFSTKSRLAHFFFGGLNYQIEHHLFPHVCHIHLFKLSPLIKEALKEGSLPYHENPTVFSALKSHFRTLKRLGSEALPKV